MELIRSEAILREAHRTREEVAAALAASGVPGELELTGAASVPGLLTKGDVDLHLRVLPDRFSDVVERLRQTYPVGSPHAWADTLAVFDVPRSRATGLAVTPVGSPHDVRFLTTWRALRERPELRAELNALKRDAGGVEQYEERKSAFFDRVAALPPR